MAVNNKLILELENESFSIKRLKTLLDTANEIDVNLDEVTLNFLTDKKLNSLMRKLKKDPRDLELIHSINQLITLGRESALSINEWEAQNIAFDIKNENFEDFLNKSNSGDKEAEAWLISFTTLAQHLNLVI